MEEGKKPAGKGGGPNHRRAEEVARECAQQTTILPKKEQEEERIEFYRPQTINVITEISTYHKIQYFDKVMYRLNAVGGKPLFDRFRKGCFGHLLHWKHGYKCNMALHHVISRQIKATGDEEEELWFLINGRKICFSILDYALVTGLNFGTSLFDPTANHDVRDVEVFKRFCGGQHISIRALVARFCDRRDPVDDEDGSLYLRVAHVLVLYAFLFGYDVSRDSRHVESWVWALVDDLEAFAKFPWGAYTYKILRHCVTNVNPKPNAKLKYHLYGPAWALHVWSVEVIPGYGVAVGKYVDKDAYPRCLRWKFRMFTTVDLQPLFEREGEHCINLSPDDTERCTQYWQSVVCPDALGVHYKLPTNPLSKGEQFPAHPRVETPSPDAVDAPRPLRNTRAQTVIVDEDEDEETQRRSNRRRDTRKRVRQPSSSSSSSGHEHHRGLSDLDLRRIEDMLRQSEDRIVNKLFSEMKSWFESWIDKVRCGCSHSTSSPTPHHMPRLDTRDYNEPQTDASLPTRHSDVHQRTHSGSPTPYSHDRLEPGHIPARCSLHEFSTSSGATPSSHQEQARHSTPLFDQLEIPPGFNAKSGKAAGIFDKKIKEEQCFDGISSSMPFSRKMGNGPSPGVLKKPAQKDAFCREEQCEALRNNPRLDTGVGGHGKSFANQEDTEIPNEESRMKRDGPIRAQSDSSEPVKQKSETSPPRAGEANVAEMLINPISSKAKRKEKKKSSNGQAHEKVSIRRRNK